MKRPSIMKLFLSLLAFSLLVSTSSLPASSNAPTDDQLSVSPTPPSSQFDPVSLTPSPSPSDYQLESEGALAKQAMLSVLARNEGESQSDRGEIFREFAMEGHWAYGVIDRQSDQGPVTIVAHLLPDGTWKAAAPGVGGIDPQWLNVVPEELAPVGADRQQSSSPTSADDSSASFSLDGVELTLRTPFMMTPTFTTSEPDAFSQIATAVDRNGTYKEFVVTAVPFGTRPGAESLPVAQAGHAEVYRSLLRDYRESQEGNPEPGPTANLFGQPIIGLISLVDLPVGGTTARPVLIVEWVVEAGNRIWIIRASQKMDYEDTYGPQDISSLVDPLTTTELDSLDVDRPSTSEASREQLLTTSDIARVDQVMPYSIDSDLPFPSWWSGDCDVNNYRAATGMDSYQLGSASYRGMKACGPGTPMAAVEFFPGAVGQYEWQCPELSKRFLYLAYGIAPYSAHGKDVVWNYSGGLLEKIHNGTPGAAPQPDDVLSYGATSTYGHTSVVVSSSVDGNGNGSITVIEQNYSSDGYSTLPVSDWWVEGNAHPVDGWLHDPNDDPPGSACPVPSLIEPSDGAVLDNETVTFRWNSVSGCTFDGYTFRVCTDPNVDDLNNCFIDTGEEGTQRTETISGWEDQDLYWGVRAANAPDGASWAVRHFRIEPGGGGMCAAPSLIEPGSGAILSDRTVTFRWNAVSGCTFEGYTFRVCTDPNVDDLSNCFIDTGEGETQRTEIIDGHDNQDLYWGVRAANAPDGASWAVRHFRIEPGSGDVVMCTTDDASSGCWIFPTVGIYDLTQTDPNLNDQIRSIHSIPSGMSVMLFREGGLRGTAECYNSSRIPLPEGHPWDLRGQVTDVQVFGASDCPSSELASVVLYDGLNIGGHHWGLGYNEGVHNMGDTGGTPSEYFNDHAESIRIPDGWSVRLYEHDNRGGQSSNCLTGNVGNLGDLNNLVSSAEVFHNTSCSYPIPEMPSNLSVGSPTDESLTLSWQDNSDVENGFKIYRWGFDGTDWDFFYHDSVGANVTSYVDTGLTCESTYFYEVSAYNGTGESLHTGWSSGDTAACPGPGPVTYNGHAVDDDMRENSLGNSDGVANCGEIVELYTFLFNDGPETATGVVVTLSTSDPHVTWLYNTSSDVPDISSGSMGINNDDFDFTLDASAPDGHILQFDLTVTADNGGPWSDQFDVTVNCSTPPKVELYSAEDFGGSVVFSDGTGLSNAPSASSYSMYVPVGWSVKTWRGDNRTGEERCWIGSASNLSWYGWENAIQSIEVFDSNVCPEVRLYDEVNYGGDSGFVNNPGRYTMEYNFNDRTESITLPSGWSVRLFKNNDYSSPAVCLTASDPDLGDNTYDDGTVVSNSATTMEVYDQSTCPPLIPDPPSNPRVVEEKTTNLTLRWQDNSDNESGFHIYRWGFDGTDWDFFYHDSVGANITSYADTDLESGTTYYYEISAYNDTGESLRTDWVMGTTIGGEVYLPLVVGNYSPASPPAAPSNLQATAISASQIRLTWQDNSSNEAAFVIYDGGTYVSAVGANTTLYIVANLASNSHHCYHIYARNSYGRSDWTDWGCASTSTTFTATPMFGTGNTWEVEWGDYDGDGDLDLAVANDSGEENELYINQGGTFARTAQFGADDTRSLAWGDYDNDNDLDMAVGNGYGWVQNFLYTNSGDGTFTSAAQFGGASSEGLDWGDYDNDGDIDLAVGNEWAQQNYLYINNGDGTFAQSSQFGISDTHTLVWGDYDTDGDLDIAVGNNDQNYLFTNAGDSFSGVEAFRGGETRDMAWADYDGDDDLDLAVGNASNGQNYLYVNNGDGTFTESQEFGQGYTYSMAWGDYDNDNDLDMAVGNWLGGQNFLYINEGDGTFTRVNEFGARYTRSVAWGDYDNDGDLDLAVGNADGQQNYLYINHCVSRSDLVPR